ncbi:START domain-containing protein [Algivirga pacifica]|uniref:START domain-containing protein n=1 Tax=Algivirga pacifica TaxID=1162670 RepID=A0ABP9DIY3_9BACT
MKLIVSALSSLLLFFSLSAYSQVKDHSWDLVSDRDAIAIYTKDTDISFKAIRAEMLINGSLEHLLYYLNEAAIYKDWLYSCEESVELKRINKDEFYYHVVVDLPSPIYNRDLVVKCRQWTDAEGTIYSESVATPDFIPEKEHTVRMMTYTSSWIIKTRPDGLLAVTYESLGDPGGALPAWLVNIACTRGPIRTMRKLKELVEAKSSESVKAAVVATSFY